MTCMGECLEVGPPPDAILFMPPPPAPAFLFPDLAATNSTNCFITNTCEAATWASTGKVTIGHGEFVEMPRKDVEANWNVSGIDDTWLLVLVASSIGVLLLGALLAMFLLKCRELHILNAPDHCSGHTNHRPIKTLETRECSTLANGGTKFITPVDSNFYHGTPSVQDNRLVWAALTPRGTQHFISHQNYSRDLLEYGDGEDHYETIDNLNTQPSPPGHVAYYGYQKDFGYEDPTPLIESYQMSNMENVDDHQYQFIGNTDMRCANLALGSNTLNKRPFSLNRPRVSSPTRIEHPNLPPLNLYPQRNTLNRNGFNYRNGDAGTLPKYGM